MPALDTFFGGDGEGDFYLVYLVAAFLVYLVYAFGGEGDGDLAFVAYLVALFGGILN